VKFPEIEFLSMKKLLRTVNDWKMGLKMDLVTMVFYPSHRTVSGARARRSSLFPYLDAKFGRDEF